MEIYTIILKDELMVDVYDSDKKLVLLDLCELEELLYQVCLVYENDFDTSLLLNAVLPLVSNKNTVEEKINFFLKEEFNTVEKHFNGFMSNIVKSKLTRLSSILQILKIIVISLRNIFIRNNLYNNCGVLKVSVVDVQTLDLVICSIGTKKCIQDLTKVHSYSISGTPLEYLRRILISY